MLRLPPGEGVLPRQLLADAIADGVIEADHDSPIPESRLQPASVDLRLGDRAYRIRCSFLPDTESVERKVKAFIEDTLDLTGEGVLLEPERPYLIPLRERLRLPRGNDCGRFPGPGGGREVR